MLVAWAAVLLVLALLVGGYYLAVAEGRAYQNSLQANQYLLKARTAYRQLINMETSERGYIISAGESFSSQYNDAQRQLPELWTYLTAKAGAVEPEPVEAQDLAARSRRCGDQLAPDRAYPGSVQLGSVGKKQSPLR